MAKCKSCGAQIQWIRTKMGKAIPVDPEPVPYWKKEGAAGRVVTPEGEILCCEFESKEIVATGVGYISHFATCPHADRHRRKMKK